MSVSEDLETRLRSLSIDRGSNKAPAHGQPALSTVPKQPKATPPRRIWRRVGGLLLLGVAGVVALTLAFPDRAPSFAAPAITKATRLWDTASGVFASQERPRHRSARDRLGFCGCSDLGCADVGYRRSGRTGRRRGWRAPEGRRPGAATGTERCGTGGWSGA